MMRIGVTARKALVAGAAVAAVILAAPPAAHADKTREAQWHLQFLKIADAHKITKGAGVTVAVIDTGVDADHPDLKGSVLPGANLTILKEGSPDGRSDADGHGTNMAGLIAAHGTASNGALGVAPEAKILPIRVQAREPDPTPGYADAVQFAMDNGAKIISVSFGGSDSDEDDQAAFAAARAAGIVVVASMGNKPEDSDPHYPAAYPGVLAVGGTDRTGNLAKISVTGEATALTGPAQDVMSTSTRSSGKGPYQSASGTSSATAIVAGVAALVRAKNPQLSADQVVELLTSTATDKGPKGRDPEFGFGIVNPVAALTAAAPGGVQPTGAAPTKATAAPSGEGIAAGSLVALFGGGLLLVGAAVGVVVWSARSRRRARY